MSFTPLTQSDAFDRSLQAMGRQTKWVDLGCATGHARALLVRLHLGWICSRGPVWHGTWPDAARLDALYTLRRAGVLVMNPISSDTGSLRHAGYRRIMTPTTIATLPLSPDWLDHAHRKWRNSFCKARAEWPASVNISEHADADWLIDACRRQASARRYRDWPARFTGAFAQANSDHSRVFAAHHGNDPIAGVMVLRHRDGASYHHAWANDEGRALGAHRVLLARAIDWLSEQGCTTLDLGTLDTDATPGLARFKLGTGAQATHLGGTWIKMPFAGQKQRVLSGVAA